MPLRTSEASFELGAVEPKKACIAVAVREYVLGT